MPHAAHGQRNGGILPELSWRKKNVSHINRTASPEEEIDIYINIFGGLITRTNFLLYVGEQFWTRFTGKRIPTQVINPFSLNRYRFWKCYFCRREKIDEILKNGGWDLFVRPTLVPELLSRHRILNTIDITHSNQQSRHIERRPTIPIYFNKKYLSERARGNG